MPAPLWPPHVLSNINNDSLRKAAFLKLMQTHITDTFRAPTDTTKIIKCKDGCRKPSERCLGKLLNFDMKTLLKASLWHCLLNKDRPKATDVSQQSRFLPRRCHAGPICGFQIFGGHVSAEDLNCDCDSHSASWPRTKKIQSLFKFKFSNYFINNCRPGLM